MKTLIVHPYTEENDTEFLCPLYETIPNKTVFRGGISKRRLLTEILHHKGAIMMLGHGSSRGLFSGYQFQSSDSIIIDETFVPALRSKPNCYFIWCNADQMVRKHGLYGIFSGMFISSVEEGLLMDIPFFEWEQVEESNNAFASIVSHHINEPLELLYPNVLAEYGMVAKKNLIARYNVERLYLNLPEHRLATDDVVLSSHKYLTNHLNMESIEFIRKYESFLEEIKEVVKVELLPILAELGTTDPHDLISSETWFQDENAAKGYVWSLFVKKVMEAK